MSVEPSLRERKKLQTHAALRQAVEEIIREQGIEAATAEHIAERAGVSRRTFFNYFPTVEAALTDGIEDFFDYLSERLEERPAGEPLMDSLEAMVTARTDPALLASVSSLGVVGLGSPAARALIQTSLDEWMQWFVGYLQRRLPSDTDPLYTTLLATSTVAAAEASIFVWAGRTGGAATQESVATLADLITRSMGYLRHGFEPCPPVQS